MDWILEEVLENLKYERKSLELRIDKYLEYKDNFKSAAATDDKFEVARHEYWGGRYLEAVENYERIKAMINDIYDMIDEESCTQEAYEDNIRELQGDASGQL